MALRVLLADESPTIKKVFQLALQDYAVEVRSVSTGSDVEPVTRQFFPDIIFADVLLQKKNGYNVSASLKASKELKSIPIVLLCSHFMDVDEDKFEVSAANARLEKPFDVKTLRNVIKNLVPKTKTQTLSEYLDFPTLPEITESGVPAKQSSSHQPEPSSSLDMTPSPQGAPGNMGGAPQGGFSSTPMEPVEMAEPIEVVGDGGDASDFQEVALGGDPLKGPESVEPRLAEPESIEPEPTPEEPALEDPALELEPLGASPLGTAEEPSEDVSILQEQGLSSEHIEPIEMAEPIEVVGDGGDVSDFQEVALGGDPLKGTEPVEPSLAEPEAFESSRSAELDPPLEDPALELEPLDMAPLDTVENTSADIEPPRGDFSSEFMEEDTEVSDFREVQLGGDPLKSELDDLSSERISMDSSLEDSSPEASQRRALSPDLDIDDPEDSDEEALVDYVVPGNQLGGEEDRLVITEDLVEATLRTKSPLAKPQAADSQAADLSATEPSVSQELGSPESQGEGSPALSNLDEAQLEAFLRAQSREVIEAVVLKLVPDLATQIIEREIKRLLEESKEV